MGHGLWYGNPDKGCLGNCGLEFTAGAPEEVHEVLLGNGPGDVLRGRVGMRAHAPHSKQLRCCLASSPGTKSAGWMRGRAHLDAAVVAAGELQEAAGVVLAVEAHQVVGPQCHSKGRVAPEVQLLAVVPAGVGQVSSGLATTDVYMTRTVHESTTAPSTHIVHESTATRSATHQR